MHYLDTVTTGPEGREFNGPLMPPIWNGTAPGFREGQIYYDIAGVLDGTPGPIYWDGSVWQKYASGSGGVPNLNDVVHQGNSTDIGIIAQQLSAVENTSMSTLARVTCYNAFVGAELELQTFGVDLGDDNIARHANIKFDAELNQVIITRGTTLDITNGSTTIVQVLSSGEVLGIPGNAPNNFVTLSQIRIHFQYDTATTTAAILNLSTVNSLFASYDEVRVTNITDATGSSIHLSRTGASTWDYVVMNKLT